MCIIFSQEKGLQWMCSSFIWRLTWDLHLPLPWLHSILGIAMAASGPLWPRSKRSKITYILILEGKTNNGHDLKYQPPSNPRNLLSITMCTNKYWPSSTSSNPMKLPIKLPIKLPNPQHLPTSQQCPFGKNRGAGLVYHLSSFTCCYRGSFKPLYENQPTNGNLGHLCSTSPNQTQPTNPPSIP